MSTPFTPDSGAFARRHIGPSAAEQKKMLGALGLASLDESERIVRSNVALHQLLGRDNAALRGVRFGDLVAAGPPETVADLQRALIDRGTEHHRVPTRYRRADGQTVEAVETVALRGGSKIVEDAVHGSFVENPIVPEAPQIELQALELETELRRHVGDADDSKVRRTALQESKLFRVTLDSAKRTE